MLLFANHQLTWTALWPQLKMDVPRTYIQVLFSTFAVPTHLAKLCIGVSKSWKPGTSLPNVLIENEYFVLLVDLQQE